MDRAQMQLNRGDFHKIAAFIKNAADDEETRAAMREAVRRGRHVYEKMGDRSATASLSRLARDARLQRDVSAFVRSATGTVDAGVKANSGRRRWLMLSFFAGIGGLLVWLTRSSVAKEPTPVAVHATETPTEAAVAA